MYNTQVIKGCLWFLLGNVLNIINDVISKFLSSDLQCFQISFLRFLFSFTLVFMIKLSYKHIIPDNHGINYSLYFLRGY